MEKVINVDSSGNVEKQLSDPLEKFDANSIKDEGKF